MYILWPSFRQSDDPLLYLTAQPQIEGAGECQYVLDVNSRSIKVSQSLLFAPLGPPAQRTAMQWLIANWIETAGLSVSAVQAPGRNHKLS